MDTEKDRALSHRERFFKNASQTATPWGIAKNWLLLIRMLVIVSWEALWFSLRLCANGLRLTFSRRARERVRLYLAARQAGSPEADQMGSELVQEMIGISYPGHQET